jgi:hypothetical protein
MIQDSSKGFRKFEFALTDALIAQLIECFDSMESDVLNLENTMAIPNGQGVYQLFLAGQLVYIGKTDTEAGLQPRLLRHATKIQSRLNLDITQIQFKAIQVLVFSAMELESLLIKYYSKDIQTAWNNSGFGANDPGRRRDDTALKEIHFDAMYPIDIDIDLDCEIADKASAKVALEAIKQKLPYLLRFDKSKAAAAELEETIIVDINSNDTVKRQIVNIVRQLPAGWQATALPGYIIIYKENKIYRHGELLVKT